MYESTRITLLQGMFYDDGELDVINTPFITNASTWHALTVLQIGPEYHLDQIGWVGDRNALFTYTGTRR